MVVNCQHVWKEISNYLDGEVDAETRAAMEAHFAECKHCTAVLDGARNVVQLYGDDRLFELPAGFARRLQRRLAAESGSSSFAGMRSFWMLAVAAGALLAGVVGLGNSSVFAHPDPRSRLAQPAYEIPPELKVVVSSEGKLFHVPGCRYLHNRVGENPETMTAAQATREGFAPCPRCLHQYLTGAIECPRSPSRHEPSTAKAQFLGRGRQATTHEMVGSRIRLHKANRPMAARARALRKRTPDVVLVGFQSR
jgi:hypothetical protein